MRILLAIAGFAILLGGSPARGGEAYALLVSVAEYDKTELRPLRFTRNDIFEFQSELRNAGWKPQNIVLLHDDPKRITDIRYLALAENIRTELKLLLSGLRSDDKLIIAFAGHGIQFTGEKESFFCPRDAKLTKRETLVSFGDILKQLDDCPAAQKLLLVDACRNDPQTDFARSRATVSLESVTRPQHLQVPKSLLAIFSCAAGQQSFEDPDLKHGVFFNYVLKGWKGAADGDKDHQLSFRELEAYVSRHTAEHARLSFKAAQTPQLKGELSGDWILRKLASAPVQQSSAPRIVPQKLFNGIDLTGWKVTAGDPDAWKVEGGILKGSTQSQKEGWLMTEREFSDYQLRLEFLLSSAGNSGVALHARQGDAKNVEVQILDDNSYPEKIHVKTGGLWALAHARPANLKPLGQWNSLDITVIGRSVIVAVNGQRILATQFGRLKPFGEMPALERTRGHIALQSHKSGPIQFRNIQIIEHGYRSIFNGRDLSGWSVDSGEKSNWTVSNGVLTATGTQSTAGWLFSDRDYGNLDLRFEVQLGSGTNSGVAFRTQPGEGANSMQSARVPEIQLQDETPGKAQHTAYEERTGALFGIVGKFPPYLGPVGSWNDVELLVNGRKLAVRVNGQVTLDNVNLDEFRSRFERIPGLERASGRIGFQALRGSVSFRNIRVR